MLDPANDVEEEATSEEAEECLTDEGSPDVAEDVRDATDEATEEASVSVMHMATAVVLALVAVVMVMVTVMRLLGRVAGLAFEVVLDALRFSGSESLAELARARVTSAGRGRRGAEDAGEPAEEARSVMVMGPYSVSGRPSLFDFALLLDGREQIVDHGDARHDRGVFDRRFAVDRERLDRGDLAVLTLRADEELQDGRIDEARVFKVDTFDLVDLYGVSRLTRLPRTSRRTLMKTPMRRRRRPSTTVVRISPSTGAAMPALTTSDSTRTSSDCAFRVSSILTAAGRNARRYPGSSRLQLR